MIRVKVCEPTDSVYTLDGMIVDDRVLQRPLLGKSTKSREISRQRGVAHPI